MISVVMGVHRLDSFLLDAINSVLLQTYKDFELLIVVNGFSNDSIVKYINENIKDSRVVVLQSKIPQLAYALNLGVDNAKYDYIARMDSDDIADPLRFEKQLSFIINNNLDLVGTGAILIDKNGEIIGERNAVKSSLINKKIVYKNCFIHPSIMYRKDFFIKVRGYNSGFNSEDYDLWLRMKRAGVRWANMPDLLLQYRIHDQASQGNILGYAEGAGYALREFILNKSMNGFFAIFYKMSRIFIRFRPKVK